MSDRAKILKEALTSSTGAGEDLGTPVDEIVVIGRRKPKETSGFSLSTFLTEISNKAVLETSRHLMIFTLPKGLLDHHTAEDVKQVALRCDASNMPGISFAESEEIRRYGVGPTEKHPYLPIFGAISASYIVDGSGDIHSFFYDWMSYIVGFDSSQGMSSVNAFGRSPYEVAYKDDYKSTVSIMVYNEVNDKVIEITLHNAYPIALNPIPLSWANTDQFMKLDVTWDYSDWSVKYHMPDSLGRDINRQEPLLNRFARLTGTLPPELGLQSLLSKVGNASQRLTDIQNLVLGSRQTIADNIRLR